MGLLLVVILSGCGFLRPAGPAPTCAAVARDYGAEFRLVGSFATTVADIRSLTPGVAPVRWPELPPEHGAVVCYLDGPFPKSLPEADPLERGVIGVAPGHSELLMAGSRDQLPIRAP